MEKQAVKIFISYSRKDQKYKEDLVEFLAPMRRRGIIESWSDTDLEHGAKWEEQLLKELDDADIVVLLVSPSFYNSDYIHDKELPKVLEKYEEEGIAVVPVLIRPSPFKNTELSTFTALPPDAKPVSEYASKDKAWMEVTKGLTRVIQRIQKEKTESSTKSETIDSEGKPNQTSLQEANSYNATGDLSTTAFDVPRKAVKLISVGETKQAIDLLLDYTQRNDNLSEYYNKIILQSGRFHGLSAERNMGVISVENYMLSLNRINTALVAILSELRD